MRTTLTEAQQLASWQAQLPDDLTVGVCEHDYIDPDTRKHYRYGAWNQAGEPWCLWNTEEEFLDALTSLEIPEED